MGEKLLSTSTVTGMLREKLKGRTIRDVAAELGVSPSYLQGVVKGEKKLGERIPAHFGLKPVTLYEWAREPAKPRR